MWTGAVYRLAAATHGIPVIGFVWIQPAADDNPWFPGGDPVVGVGDEEFDAGEVVGDVLCYYSEEGNVIILVVSSREIISVSTHLILIWAFGNNLALDDKSLGSIMLLLSRSLGSISPHFRLGANWNENFFCSKLMCSSKKRP